MSEKFTKGPWRLDDDNELINDVGSVKIYSPFMEGFKWTGAEYHEAIANMHLISAAPELYDALKDIVEQWDTPNWKLTESTSVFIEKARAALRKARGE